MRPCAICLTPIPVFSNKPGPQRKYCSRKCNHLADKRRGRGEEVPVYGPIRPLKPKPKRPGWGKSWRTGLGRPLDEFYIPEPMSGCWLWLGARSQGYGRYTPLGTQGQAHRVIYEMCRGPIPEGLEVDHLCRNHSCVNPAHLEPVTHQENQRRMGLAKRASNQLAKGAQ